MQFTNIRVPTVGTSADTHKLGYRMWKKTCQGLTKGEKTKIRKFQEIGVEMRARLAVYGVKMTIRCYPKMLHAPRVASVSRTTREENDELYVTVQ